MSTSSETTLFLELSELTVQIVRARGRTIELHRECLRDNREGLEEALKAAAPARASAAVAVMAAISPSRRFAHRATDQEFKRLRTLEAIASQATLPRAGADGPLALALCNCEDGGALASSSTSRWLALGASQDSLASAQAFLAEFSLRDTVATPAITNHLGALQAACQLSGAPSSVLVWDLGSANSHFYLVNRKGVLATESCSVGFNQIADAIRIELSLTSREAATKLFLNAFFDFTDTGPKVAKRLAPAVKSSLNALGGAPSALFCLGLPAENTWFPRDVGALLGMSGWKPAITALGREFGVDFAGNALANKLSFNAVGLLHLAGAHASKSETWRPHWQMVDTQLGAAPQAAKNAAPLATDPAPAAPAPQTEQDLDETDDDETESDEASTATELVPQAAAARTTSSASILAQASARATALTRQTALAGNGGVTATPPSETQALASSDYGKTETKALLSGTTRTRNTSKAADLPKSGSVVSAMRRSAAYTSAPPTSPPASAPSAAAPYGKGSTPIVEPQATQPAKANSKGLWIALIVVLLAAASVSLWFTLEARKEHEQVLIRQAAEAEQRAAEALALAKQSEEAAHLEAERIRKEAEVERENAIAAVKLRTEAEVLQRVEAERLATAPGILVVRTEPSGAYVSIDGALPQATPLTTNSLSIGTHHISISLPGYDTTTRTVEIKHAQTTDLGLIELTRQYGGMEIISEPSGLTFELRSAADKPDAEPLLTGITPATLSDLEVGEYTVTLLRPGWKSVTSPATVASLSHAQVVPLFSTARLLLTSTPSGATVLRDGEAIGTTPLQLSELTPGDYVFELSFPEHDSSLVKTRLVASADAEVATTLDPFDRILKNSEIAQAPVAIKTVAPDYTVRGNQNAEKAVISCVIDRNGVPQSLQVENTTTEAFGQACMAALQQWRFNPAKTKTGRTANVKVSVPFTLGGR